MSFTRTYWSKTAVERGGATFTGRVVRRTRSIGDGGVEHVSTGTACQETGFATRSRALAWAERRRRRFVFDEIGRQAREAQS